MPPKRWRTISNKMATPFRKLSFSERSRSRSPSRQGSTDFPRSGSPTLGDEPRARIVLDDPAPVLDTVTTKPPADEDAVDLDSPTGSTKGEPTDAPIDLKSPETDLTPKEDKPAEETKQVPPAEPDQVVYHAEPLHHEHPVGEEQHSDDHQQATPKTKEETKPVEASETPEVPRADDEALANQVKLDDELDLKNAPEPASAGTDDSRDFYVLIGDHTGVWADEEEGDVTVSSPPFNHRTDLLVLRRPVKAKSGVTKPELPPKEPVAHGPIDPRLSSGGVGSAIPMPGTIPPVPALPPSVSQPEPLSGGVGSAIPMPGTIRPVSAFPPSVSQPVSGGVGSAIPMPGTIHGDYSRPVSALVPKVTGPTSAIIAAATVPSSSLIAEPIQARNPAPGVAKAPKDPFGNFFFKIFVGLFCFGIPYKYVPKDGHYHKPSETDALLPRGKTGPLLADSPIFTAALTLV
ncbi:hypothetical protein FRC04_009869, partial [Tulasnella sp. 424]